MEFPQDLFGLALGARPNAYAPYSGYLVSCALRCADSSVHIGVNFENESYGGSICAERNAVGAMVTSGARQISELVVVTVEGGTPCGICRQILSEFCDSSTRVWCCDLSGFVQSFTMGELLPHGWKSDVVSRKLETS